MKTHKKVIKVWPQTLKKGELLEEFQEAQSKADEWDNIAHLLQKECERRGIDPWE